MWLAQAVPKKEITASSGSPALLGDIISRSLNSVSKEVWAPIRRRPTVCLSTAPLKTPARGRALKTVPGWFIELPYCAKYLT